MTHETLFVVNNEAAAAALREILPREIRVRVWGEPLTGHRFDTIFVVSHDNRGSETEKKMAEQYFNEVLLTKVAHIASGGRIVML
jgi:hypothetical protein